MAELPFYYEHGVGISLADMFHRVLCYISVVYHIIVVVSSIHAKAYQPTSFGVFHRSDHGGAMLHRRVSMRVCCFDIFQSL